MTAVSAIVVAYGEEPWLERCVSSLIASDDVVVEVIVVDNTGTGPRSTRSRGGTA